MGRLDGKVAIVTGSGRGLGRAYAIAMAKEGCDIVTNDMDDSANAVAEEIKKLGRRAIPVIAGVGTKETADKLFTAAVKDLGKLDILVNNAGMTRDAMMTRMTEEQFDDVIRVHLRGTWINTQAAIKYFIENNVRGRIINTTSPAGLYGNVGQANYCAAKAGIIGLTKSNSRELAHYGITVNVVAPGAATAMTEGMPDKVKVPMYEKLWSRSTITPEKRIGTPEDVAPLIIWLASDESYYVTGQTICAMGTIGVI